VTTERQKRGWATMTSEQQRAVASKGGKAAHAQGVAHEFQKGSELARAAGRKGGQIHKERMAARRAERENASLPLTTAATEDETRDRA
jgi:general stress protein YciG